MANFFRAQRYEHLSARFAALHEARPSRQRYPLKGGGGNDTFILGANPPNADTIDNGSGNDSLTLTGSNYQPTAHPSAA